MTKFSRRKFLGIMPFTLTPGLLLKCNEQTINTQNASDMKKYGVALIGLGSYSTYQLGPALMQTKNCYLAGIVTGTPSKEKMWAKI